MSPRSFEGRAFHESLPGGQQEGTLTASPAGVTWIGEHGRIDLPLHGLHLEIGGASDRVVFFTHPGLPGWALTTLDRRMLDEPALKSHPDVAALVAGAHRKRRIGTILTASVLGAIVLGIAALVVFRGAFVRAAAAQVPPEIEVALGEAAAEGIGGGMVPAAIGDDETKRALAAITGPLLAGVGPTRYEYEFHILDAPSVNAFALPGGHVFIHSGLILRADRPEEVAGVLAHEIAHVQERHALRSIVEQLGLSVLAQLVVGDSSGMQAVLVSAGPQLLGLKFSRDFEREADVTGFGYLVRAGLDPTGMASMFRKLKEDEAAGLGVLQGAADALTLLSTHPAADERFVRLDELARERAGSPASRTLELNFPEFQERIRSLAKGPAPALPRGGS